MIPIYRYSSDGFSPKVQSYHLGIFSKIKETPDFSGFSQFQTNLMESSRRDSLVKLNKLNLEDWKEGVFVFFNELPVQSWIDHELNHLKTEERIGRRLYRGVIDPKAEVYSVYGLIPELYKAGDYLKFSGSAAFIPKRSLEFVNDIHSENF